MLVVLCSKVHKNGAMAMVGIGISIRLDRHRYQTQIGNGTGIRTTPVLYQTEPDLYYTIPCQIGIGTGTGIGIGIRHRGEKVFFEKVYENY